MTHVLIGDEEIKGVFCATKRISIGQVAPAHFMCSLDVMSNQCVAEWHRGSLIKEDPHA